MLAAVSKSVYFGVVLEFFYTAPVGGLAGTR